jgi:hypothetical protein
LTKPTFFKNVGTFLKNVGRSLQKSVSNISEKCWKKPPEKC